MTGQISGIVGNHGNVGSLLFLTLLLVAGPTVFFVVIAASAIVAAVCCRWLREPADAFSDRLAVDAPATTAASVGPIGGCAPSPLRATLP